MFVSRLWLPVIGWSVLLIVSIAMMFDGVSLVEAVAAVAATIALASELVGTRLSAGRLSCPWRPVPGLPQIGVGRVTVPCTEIQHLTGLPSSFGFQQVKVRTIAAEATIVLFGKRADKTRFFDVLATAVPTLSIYRAS